jgi:hypothetical protein
MELRNHPLMSYRDVSNWPPTWTKTGAGGEYRSSAILRGEIGTLDRVILSRIEPDARIFLVIQFSGNSYMGTLLFKDGAFCRHIADVLQAHLGKTIEEIGALELSYTL